MIFAIMDESRDKSWASQDADRRLWMKTANYGMGLVPIFYLCLWKIAS